MRQPRLAAASPGDSWELLPVEHRDDMMHVISEVLDLPPLRREIHRRSKDLCMSSSSSSSTVYSTYLDDDIAPPVTRAAIRRLPLPDASPRPRRHSTSISTFLALVVFRSPPAADAPGTAVAKKLASLARHLLIIQTAWSTP